MHVYHCSIESRGFFTKTDRQPSGGGTIASPYLHDLTLNFAFYAALKNARHSLPENPQYLENLQYFFNDLPTYIYPTIISKGFLASETLNTLTEKRGMPAIGNQDNVPKKNRWTGYKRFFADTTVLSSTILPTTFYLRLGKKRALVLVNLKEVKAKKIEGEYDIGIISPIMHTGLTYTSGTLVRINPSPLYIGKVKGRHILYQTNGLPICKPLQFRYFGALNA
jgi:hypothetical protein